VTAVSVQSWVLGLRRRERWQRAARLAAPWLLALGVLFGCGALLLRPRDGAAPSVPAQWLLVALLGVGALVVLVAAWPRRTPWRRLDDALGLGGMLETYVDPSASTDGPMRAWLERDLAASIPMLASGVGARRLVGVPVRPLRSLLVLLALLYLLGFVLPPLPDGVLPMGSGAMGGAAGAGPGGAPEPIVAQASPPDAQEEAPADPPAPESEPPPTTLPPEALIAAPETRDAVVVPSFVGDGAGTVQKSAVVDVESAPPAAGGSAAGPKRGGSGGGGEPEISTPEDPDFRRAAEQAMRSRHVPPAERAFVERWFRVERGGER